MKIGIFVNNLAGGGAERIAVDIADNLPTTITRQIVTILDLSSAYPHTTERISLTKNQKDRITTVVLLTSFVHFVRYLHREKPDISISLLTHANILNILGCLFSRTKAIISVHEMPSQKFTRGMDSIRRILYTLTKYTDTHIVTVSHGVKDELMQIYNLPSDKITVIHNPINIQEILTLSTVPLHDLEEKEHAHYIITVGRLNRVKGQWHLIRAFAELRKKQPCTLLICGDGELRNSLTLLADECGVLGDVIFLGWQDNPYKYLSKAAVFVQSSLSEALPNVLVESLACGCPVIAANCSGGIEEILGTDNLCGFITERMSGIYHSAQDPLDNGEQSLLECMEKILNYQKFRDSMSIAGKERAKLFDRNAGIQRYVEVFEKVSRNKK